MDVIGDMGNPEKVAAALKPVVDGFGVQIGTVVDTAVKDLPATIQEALDGLTITITISRKP